MAGRNAIQGAEIKRVQHRGYTCHRFGQAGKVNHAYHGRIHMVLPDRRLHRRTH